MSAAVYLIGAPGVGKSTVMAALHDELGVWPAVDQWYRLPGYRRPELHVEPLVDMLDQVAGLSLGRTREQFSGTDALSMSASYEAVRWAQDSAADIPELVLGEGARLATVPFLAALSLRVDQLEVVYLQAAETALEDRRSGRTQTPTFLKAASTRAANAAVRLKDAGLLTATIMTDTLSPVQVARVIAERLD